MPRGLSRLSAKKNKPGDIAKKTRVGKGGSGGGRQHPATYTCRPESEVASLVP